MSLKPMKIVISGGGTGGHIFPAIAIADTLKKRVPGADVLFVGASDRMEMQKVPQAGYPIIGLWISGFQRNLSLKNLLFPVKVIVALLKAVMVLRKFRPDVVIGVGGYASGPTLRAAIMLKIPTLIQEQNSFPGVTNRILGRKVNRICVAFGEMERWFPADKLVLAGNPLRKSAVDIAGKQDEAIAFFGLHQEKQTLLIVGGSQGARAINQAIEKNIEALAGSGIQLIWQTGESFLAQAQLAVKSVGAADQIKPVAFIHRMDLAYAAADLIVSRAGAIAIAEIAVVRKPAIFIPLPTAAEDHQTKNALRLQEAKAAMVVSNGQADEKLLPEINRLLANPGLLAEMSENMLAFAMPDAAERIVEEVIKVAGR